MVNELGDSLGQTGGIDEQCVLVTHRNSRGGQLPLRTAAN
jgi:hypothetical protein